MLKRSRGHCRRRLLVAVLIVVLASFQPVSVEQGLQQSIALMQCAKSSVEGTLRTFWMDAGAKCPKDPYKLLELYESMLRDVAGDKCHNLMVHHVRKMLIDSCATRLAEALISLTPVDSEEITTLSQRLSPLAVKQAVWERAIDEVHLFVDRDLITTALLQSQSLEALLYLYRKSVWSPSDNDMRNAKLANHLRKARGEYTAEFRVQLDAAYATMPAHMQVLYAAVPIRLINRESYDYMIAAESVEMNNRLLPFTWLGKDENEKDVNGDRDLVLEYRSNADISISTRRGSALHHLYYDVEYDGPDFWLGTGKRASRWWEVHENTYGLLFVNSETRRVLCMDKKVDEFRRAVVMLPLADAKNRQKCSWAPIKVAQRL